MSCGRCGADYSALKINGKTVCPVCYLTWLEQQPGRSREDLHKRIAELEKHTQVDMSLYWKSRAEAAEAKVKKLEALNDQHGKDAMYYRGRIAELKAAQLDTAVTSGVCETCKEAADLATAALQEIANYLPEDSCTRMAQKALDELKQRQPKAAMIPKLP